MARPSDHKGTIETVNDKDMYLANYWRATKYRPQEVAEWADWPVNEVDLRARHRWLVEEGAARLQALDLMENPDAHDTQVAGWWLWGICQWIGSGWCAQGNQHKKIHHLGDAGRGIHRQLPEQRPHLSDAGMGIHRGVGGRTCEERTEYLREYMQALSDRLRNVRVCCGDWTRVLGPSATTGNGLTGVFLDPPYSLGLRDNGLYSHDNDLGQAVRDWAVEHGGDPLMRIAICGYDGEYDMPPDWECLAWKANGGYKSQRRDGENENAHRERVWFSPGCLRVARKPFQKRLF